MVITGFNLAASDYRRNRRTLLALTGATALLILLLAGQILVWGANDQEVFVCAAYEVTPKPVAMRETQQLACSLCPAPS